jgi:hypothetical protein
MLAAAIALFTKMPVARNYEAEVERAKTEQRSTTGALVGSWVMTDESRSHLTIASRGGHGKITLKQTGEFLSDGFPSDLLYSMPGMAIGSRSMRFLMIPIRARGLNSRRWTGTQRAELPAMMGTCDGIAQRLSERTLCCDSYCSEPASP